MKRLPIARTVFREIMTENFCYVDKTPFVKKLSEESNKYIFLSRPRRFGKSLFVDTLRAAYAGEKDLFSGLFLENNWDWSKQYPIIEISLAGGTKKTANELKNSLNYILKNEAQNNDIKLDEIEISDRFSELISKLYKKYKLGVVVLIDEYDKPLLDNLTKDTAVEIREELAGFYSVLKDTEKHLKFVFITGVSKFSKTSIFSKLNNLTEISLDRNYSDICGYTHEDLTNVFADYLHDVDLKKVKVWYDGYNFLGTNLFNPYDILLFLKNKEYKPHWFETGTPTFLLDLIKKRKFYVPQLEKIEITGSQMGEFDIDNIEIDVLLFQTGYLTIEKVEQIDDNYFYSLKIPNKEVRKGLTDYLLRMFYAAGINSYERTSFYKKIYFAIADNKPEDLENALYSFFASVPHDWYRKNNIAEFEGFYSSIFYACFAALGMNVIPEDTTNKGRIDLTITTDTNIFIFEFKMKINPKNALEQIKEKKYSEKYLNQNKEIFLIGIEFDENEKNISKFECEKFKL